MSTPTFPHSPSPFDGDGTQAPPPSFSPSVTILRVLVVVVVAVLLGLTQVLALLERINDDDRAFDFASFDLLGRFSLSLGVRDGDAGDGTLSGSFAALTDDQDDLAANARAAGAPAGALAIRIAALRLLDGDPEGAAVELDQAAGIDPTVCGVLAESLRGEPAEATAVAGELEPSWARQAFLIHLYDASGEATLAEQVRAEARRDARVFLGLVSPVFFLWGLGLACGGLVVLPAYGVLRLVNWRRQTAAASPLPASLPHAGDPPWSIPEPAPPPRPPSADTPEAAQPVLQPAQWSLLEAAEVFAVFFAGQWIAQVGASLLAALAGRVPSDGALLSIGYVAGSVAAIALVRWRAAARPDEARHQAGLVPTKPGGTALWGVGGYLAAMPLVFASTLLVQRLAGRWDSLSPAIDATQGAGSVVERVGLFVAIVIMAAIAEEVVFRGCFFAAIRHRLGAAWAVWLTALVFSLVHFDPFVSPQLFVLGLVLGHVRERSGSLYPCMVVHGLWNGMQFLLMMAMSL